LQRVPDNAFSVQVLYIYKLFSCFLIHNTAIDIATCVSYHFLTEFFLNFLSLSPQRVYPFVSFSLFFSCFSLINSQYCAKNLLLCFLLFLFVSSPNHIFSCPIDDSEDVFLPLCILFTSHCNICLCIISSVKLIFFFLQNFF